MFSSKELVENSDIVVIAVPARFTASTAEGLKAFANSGQLFADVTTALPPVKEKLAKEFAELGAEYIDSAMLGSLMALGHKVPILASGKGCKRWHDTMNPFNMKISLVNPDDPDNTKVGEASKIKLVRSVFMKGIEGLIVETLLFARKCGVEPLMAMGTKERLARTAALGLNQELHGIIPKEFDKIYSLWEEKQYS